MKAIVSFSRRLRDFALQSNDGVIVPYQRSLKLHKPRSEALQMIAGCGVRFEQVMPSEGDAGSGPQWLTIKA
jgi:hypothetical protein